MLVRELDREQLIKRKGYYFNELVNEGSFAEVVGREYDSPTWEDMVNIDGIVPDDVIFEHYEGVDLDKGDLFVIL